MYEWKWRFSKSPSTSCKSILDGIHEIEECGIVLEPVPQLTQLSPREPSTDLSREPSTEQDTPILVSTSDIHALSESPFNDVSAESLLNMRSGFDLKVLYRHVSQLLASLDERGDAIFLDPPTRNILLLCSFSQPELLHMIESEVFLGTNEKVWFPIKASSSACQSAYFIKRKNPAYFRSL